jgi:hypothetical protein
MKGINRELTEEEYEQYFQTIKAVLREYRHVTKYQVSNSTGVPMEVIRRLLKEGRLEEKVDGSLEANEDIEKQPETAEEKRKRLIEDLKNHAEASHEVKERQIKKEEQESSKKKGIKFHTRDDRDDI